MRTRTHMHLVPTNIYLLAVLVACGALLFTFWPQHSADPELPWNPRWSIFTFAGNIDDQLRLLLLTISAGGLGGAMSALTAITRNLNRYDATGANHLVGTWFRPWIGAGAALATYLLLTAAIPEITAPSESGTPRLIIIAATAGLFSSTLITQLNNISRSLLNATTLNDPASDNDVPRDTSGPSKIPSDRSEPEEGSGPELDHTRLEQTLESLRNRIKAFNEDRDRDEELLLWEEMSRLLEQLDREGEALDARRNADRLRNELIFETNVGPRIQLRALSVTDLDFFGTFNWYFSPHINVLLGKNGYGKSHLFGLIVALLQSNDEKSGDYVNLDSAPGALVDLDVDKDHVNQEVHYTKVGFEKNALGKAPLLAISELRFLDKSRGDIGKEDFDEIEELKTNGAWHFLNGRPLGPVIQDFLFRLCLESTEKDSLDLPIIKLYYDVVRRLTANDFEIVEIRRRRNSSRYIIRVKTEGNDQPVLLQQASQGTLSIMALVGLIFDFLRSVFPEIPEQEVALQHGIVFIDELDAHMHPSWQRKIIGILRDTFPTVQFILAAHSPLVVAGCKEGEVVVLRRDGPTGFHLEQIDRHFIGATTSELYSSVFEIEEKDDTYLKYAAMYPFRSDIEEEANKLLAAAAQLSPDERRVYDEIADKQRALDHKRRFAQSVIADGNPSLEARAALAKILKEAQLQDHPEPELMDALQQSFTLSDSEQQTLEKLAKKQQLPKSEAIRLKQLKEDLYYLEEFKRIETKRSAMRQHADDLMLDMQDTLAGVNQEAGSNE